LAINCLVLGGTLDRVFEIKIASTSSVHKLKDAVLKQKAITLKDIEADSLTLWNVAIPVDIHM
jgi:hypothetical protein